MESGRKTCAKLVGNTPFILEMSYGLHALHMLPANPLSQRPRSPPPSPGPFLPPSGGPTVFTLSLAEPPLPAPTLPKNPPPSPLSLPGAVGGSRELRSGGPRVSTLLRRESLLLLLLSDDPPLDAPPKIPVARRPPEDCCCWCKQVGGGGIFEGGYPAFKAFKASLRLAGLMGGMSNRALVGATPKSGRKMSLVDRRVSVNLDAHHVWRDACYLRRAK